MRRVLLIFILQNLFQHLCLAQSDTLKTLKNYKMIISITGGAAIPVGVFGKFENDKMPFIYQGGNIAGGSSIGYYGKLDLRYLIQKHFGLTAMLYSSVNNSKELTQEEINEPYTTSLGGFFRITSYTHDTKVWYTKGALVGIYVNTGTKFIDLDFKLSMGVQQVKSPVAHIYEEGYNWLAGVGTTDTYLKVETQPSMISYNIVGNLGMGIGYSITRKLRARIGIENFFSQAKFEGSLNYMTDKHYTNGANEHSEYLQEIQFTKNIFLFCFSVGTSYILN